MHLEREMEAGGSGVPGCPQLHVQGQPQVQKTLYHVKSVSQLHCLNMASWEVMQVGRAGVSCSSQK